MVFSTACQCLFTLFLVSMAASPLQAHGRESRFFSKVSRTEPKTTNPKAEETQSLSPSDSSPFKEAASEQQGYGLFGNQETYQYPPTTTNPTKSEPGRFRYGTGEKQGMSDTRFLENGRYFYDLQNEEVANNGIGRLKENNDGHGSYYGGQYKGQSYVTGEKQGMSDTRFLENGRYFYDLEAEEKQNKANNAELYTTNDKYESEENEGEEEKYEDERYGTREKQGVTGEERQGKYNEASYEPDKYGESYDSNYENENENDKEDEKYNRRGNGGYATGNFGKGYDFKTTPNKFPNYEFDSIEEYEKYEQGRSHQKEHAP